MAKVKTRLYVRDQLSEQKPISLDKQQSHFLKNVLRLEVGHAVALFNGEDGEWYATISHLTKSYCELLPVHLRQEQTVPRFLRLLFAPIKKDPLNFLIEKGTELGVTVFQPVITKHTNVERVRVERLQTNATEAAEQCGRLEVPLVMPPVSLSEALSELSTNERLLACLESGEAEQASTISHASGQNVSVLIGPEGGFSQEELDSLRKNSGVSPISLGPRILRAETAAISAIAIFQSQHGDWNERPKKTLWPDSFPLKP
jgi:16S rRNA (uracil1498-N3)-methyltransferase